VMQVTKAQLEQALHTGLKMLRDDNVRTPNSWNRDLIVLDDIIRSLLAGQLEINVVGEPESPEPLKSHKVGEMLE